MRLIGRVESDSSNVALIVDEKTSCPDADGGGLSFQSNSGRARCGAWWKFPALVKIPRFRRHSGAAARELHQSCEEAPEP
jgi:hypothetical protein